MVAKIKKAVPEKAKKPKKRGGRRPGAGRTPVAEAPRDVWITMRCTPEEKEVYADMGGNEMLRDMIRARMEQ